MRTNDTPAAVIPDRLSEALFDAGSAHLVTIVSIDEHGTPAVQVTPDGPAVTAKLAIVVTRARIERAIAERHEAVTLFESGDQSRPIIVGFVEALRADPVPSEAVSAGKNPVIEADVDGRRVCVTAKDEIVLECGQASVTLRRNGRVIIRGTYVETRSEGTNRIKGGQVQIN